MGCSCQNNESSIGRFQRAIFTTKKKKNTPTVYQVQKSLACLSQGTMTMSANFTKLKGLWDQLEAYHTLPTHSHIKANNEQREEDQLMQFLVELNDTYNIVHTNVLMMSPLPNVCQTYSLVIQDENSVTNDVKIV